MTDHAATLTALVLCALCIVLAFVTGGLHLSPRVSSPLNRRATIVVSTVLVVLASLFLTWGLLHLGFQAAR